MHDTTRTRFRRALRRTAALTTGALALGALQAGAAGAAESHPGGYPWGHPGGQRTWTVQSGQSIQAAVDRARSGDTIKIAPGTYEEAVCVDGKGLKVVGAGRDRTRIVWPEWDTVADLPAVAENPCLRAHESADAEGEGSNLADDVSGLFFLHPDSPVLVAGLTTRNHPADGIAAWGADGFVVHATRGVGHERYGVLAAASTRISITGNVEQGVTRSAPVYSGTGGISVGDSARAHALVLGNHVRGYNIGVFLRESRTGHVVGNAVTGNCVGVLVFDDSATEIPDRTANVVGGDWKLTANSSVANNRYCIAGRDGSQLVSGVGMAVVNADDVSIRANSIRDNRPVVPAGQAPINFPPGGLVLLGFAPPPGTSPPGAADPGTVEDIRVTGNSIRDNRPVDVWVTRAVPQNPLVLAPGPGIVFEGNRCGTSDPAGICGS